MSAYPTVRDAGLLGGTRATRAQYRGTRARVVRPPRVTGPRAAPPSISPQVAAQLKALNPSGVSNLGATSLPGWSPPTAASSGATAGYDFTKDPVFQQAMALTARTESEAQAQALAKKKQLAIQFGDAAGLGLDPATSAAATGNPFSVLGTLDRSYGEGVNRLEDSLNKSNLFYSGWRGKQLSDASTANQQNRYDARSRFQASLSDVEQALQSALMNAEWQKLQLLEQQYQTGLSDPSSYAPPAADPAADPAAGINWAGIAAALAGKPKTQPKLSGTQVTHQ